MIAPEIGAHTCRLRGAKLAVVPESYGNLSMSFGKRFGQLVRRKRDIEGLSQQNLAAQAFGDEERKSRISELENGHVTRPQSKTIDALVVALNISEEELSQVLNDSPHPGMVDTLVDLFDASHLGRVHVEIAVNEHKEIYFFYDCPMKHEILRLEYFAEERQLIWVTSNQSRRPFGTPVDESVAGFLPEASEVIFCKILTGGEFKEEARHPLLVIT